MKKKPFTAVSAEELLRNLEQETPLIVSNYTYKCAMTDEEIHEHETEIARLTIEIQNLQMKVKEMNDEIKGNSQQRATLAVVLKSGELERVSEKAVMFYDQSYKTVNIYVQTETGYQFERTREAFPAEIAKWKLQQEEIRQTEIEPGQYRQSLQQIAEFNGIAQL